VEDQLSDDELVAMMLMGYVMRVEVDYVIGMLDSDVIREARGMISRERMSDSEKKII